MSKAFTYLLKVSQLAVILKSNLTESKRNATGSRCGRNLFGFLVDMLQPWKATNIGAARSDCRWTNFLGR